MATRSRPTEKWGPRAAMTTARMSGSEPMAAMARGRSDQKSGPMALRFSGRSSHKGGHVAVHLDGQDVGGEGDGGRGRRVMAQSVGRMPWPSRPGRRLARPGQRSERPNRQVGWASRLVTGPPAREALVLSTFTPETAATLPGLPWLQRRRRGCRRGVLLVAHAQREGRGVAVQPDRRLDLDRFRPAGTVPVDPANDPGPSPSDRVHTLVTSLGARSGLVVTINGVLATRGLVGGRRPPDPGPGHRACRRRVPPGFGGLRAPATSSCSTMPSPSTRWSSTWPLTP